MCKGKNATANNIARAALGKQAAGTPDFRDVSSTIPTAEKEHSAAGHVNFGPESRQTHTFSGSFPSIFPPVFGRPESPQS